MFEQQLMISRVDELQPLAFQTAEHFIDIGIPEDFERAQQQFATKRKP